MAREGLDGLSWIRWGRQRKKEETDDRMGGVGFCVGDM